ncbi:hypothetical protein ACXYTJ_12645 [Gilvimarinus sp. F26214L]|uniref:hypothetical protein n=1 Tax=Gilvimarinus sp. DZF01 TaxID=3461371 RepID=UPI0040462AFF
MNETDQRVARAVVDEPFQHYNASAQVFDEGPTTCGFVWVDGKGERIYVPTEAGLPILEAGKAGN